jgi:hypothetical protein
MIVRVRRVRLVRLVRVVRRVRLVLGVGVIVVVRMVMVRVIVAVGDGGRRAVLVQTELRCRDAGSQDAFSRDLEIVDGKAAQSTAQRVERQPASRRAPRIMSPEAPLKQSK